MCVYIRGKRELAATTEDTAVPLYLYILTLIV